MDKAALSTRKTFRTKCNLAQLLCLLAGLLPSLRAAGEAGSGLVLLGAPSLVTYRPKIVERSTRDDAFVLSRKKTLVLCN